MGCVGDAFKSPFTGQFLYMTAFFFGVIAVGREQGETYNSSRKIPK